jgi:heat shock protein HslJ
MRLFAGLAMFLVLAGTSVAEDRKPDAPLSNTYWKLLTAGGVPAAAAENRREAHFILRLDGTVGGSTGCNAMSGTWKVEGTALILGPIATTRMFCAETAATEKAFTAALNQAKGWKIAADDMSLTGAAGETLATFTAIYF